MFFGLPATFCAGKKALQAIPAPLPVLMPVPLHPLEKTERAEQKRKFLLCTKEFKLDF